ncbi:SHOCT domain-containing protein [Rhodoferax sp. BAB1]|uniref:SHOCT domain-containing protein n=1 Tax=Rhodoferax sp. BAB1 TaxID=2741720 RepID=UPI0020C63ADA|nr:SHOCT domain-containing protein [Rhodoferax sp. BAB1]
MYFGDGYYMVGMHAFWWIFWVIIIIALLFGPWPPSRGRDDGLRETPHQVLRRRLAKGEIKPEEYEQLKQLLGKDE